VPTDDERLEQLAGAVLDGSPVDWKTAESDADPARQRLVQHLKVVAAVAGVHRMPDTWGHLRVIERIGSGSFGDVYRAWDSRLDREVALKLLPADPRDDRHTSSIIHEGRLLARVDHPNIVTIHGPKQIGDRIGLWMELVRGRTLEEMLAHARRSVRGSGQNRRRSLQRGRGGSRCRADPSRHQGPQRDGR
jgi:serine/threonine protein kinase